MKQSPLLPMRRHFAEVRLFLEGEST